MMFFRISVLMMLVFSISNCSNRNGDISDISPAISTVKTGDSSKFKYNSNLEKPSYSWQSDIGFGFQTVSDAGQYSGSKTNTLKISSVKSENNNQKFRCIASTWLHTDTSLTATLLVIK